MKIRKNISLSPDTVVKLDALAKANGATASGIITQLILTAAAELPDISYYAIVLYTDGDERVRAVSARETRDTLIHLSEGEASKSYYRYAGDLDLEYADLDGDDAWDDWDGEGEPEDYVYDVLMRRKIAALRSRGEHL